jgi:hypothetical protein
MCGPHSRSGRSGEEKNVLPVPGFEPGPFNLTANAPRKRDTLTGMGLGASRHTDQALQTRLLHPTAQSEELDNWEPEFGSPPTGTGVLFL